MSEEKGRVVRVGDVEVNLEEVVSGGGMEEIGDIATIATDILHEMGEKRLRQWKPKLNIFADATDIAEWDSVLLSRYCPVYTEIKRKRDYGLESSLREACRGLSRQLAFARELLDLSIELFGRDKEIEIGHSITYPTLNISMLTGFYTKNLGDMDRALSYAESQLSKLLSSDSPGVAETEEKTLHAGALILLAMEISEAIKMCCFDFYNAGKQPATEYSDFPKVETEVGIGAVDTTKPVIVFLGNNFMPAWFAIEYIRRAGLEDTVEVCGAGAVGHDIPRFYKRGKVLTSATKIRKVFRTGIPDVVVVSDSCFEFDLLAEAKRVDAKVIACGNKAGSGLEDRSDDSVEVEEIIKEMMENDLPGIKLTNLEKAGELAVKLAQEIKRRGKRKKSYLLSEDEIKEESSRCKSCDTCSGVCPSRLALSRAMKGGVKTLADAYDGCIFCGECERACPEGIPVMDLIISAASATGKLREERYLMRAGRGPMSELEWRDLTFGIILGGNGPGMVNIIGCGNYPGSEREVADIARYFLERNALVTVSGCVAADVARYFDAEERKFLFEQYIAAGVLKGLVNFGGCTAISHVTSAVYRGALVGSGYVPKANWTQIADYLYARLPVVVILWGAAAEEMYAVASGLVRSGIPVVVGPSGFKFKRYFMGDKYDRSKWWMYDGVTGEKKEVEPCPVHMLVPVETKEEAIAMCAKLLHRPLALRDPRLASLEAANEAHKDFFGEYPDDWYLYVRSEHELHVMRRMELLRKLEQEHGWEIEGMRIKRARHRSGELMDMAEYNRRYGIQLGRYSTLVPRLIVNRHLPEIGSAPQ